MNQLRRNHNNDFAIDDGLWQTALRHTMPGADGAGVRRASLGEDNNYRLFVAEFSGDSNHCFYARKEETCKIVSGQGQLYLGLKTADSGLVWDEPWDIARGESFIIPEGYSYRLVSAADRPLVALFRCP